MSSTPSDKEYALVTGASKGLGRAFARELTRRKINTILVGLPDEDLSKLSDELSENHNISSVFFATDLTQKQNVIKLARQVNENYNVNILINNVGMGGSKEFLKADVEYIDKIIQLNVMATSLLTHQLLPNLLNQAHAYILNISSMSAFSPTGYKTVYPASKVFVNYFSRSLCQELANTNIFVGVANPGPIRTNNEVIHRINKQGIYARMGILPAEEVAHISLKKLFRRKKIILLSKTDSIRRILMKIVPIEIKLPLLTRITKRELKS